MDEKLKIFLVRQAAVEEGEVTSEASLENDLGIYGDDATEIIIAFGKEFNVDVSRFMAADYFSGEAFIFLGKKRKTKDLKVSHLEKAIDAGRLDEKVING
jgi:acyl carrier protein